MQFYAMKLRELAKNAGTCEKCGNLRKLRFDKRGEKSDSPNTLFSLGYYLNIKSNFLLLSMINKHTTSQKVLGIFKFSSCFFYLRP
jgi:hypothetical protein